MRNFCVVIYLWKLKQIKSKNSFLFLIVTRGVQIIRVQLCIVNVVCSWTEWHAAVYTVVQLLPCFIDLMLYTGTDQHWLFLGDSL